MTWSPLSKKQRWVVHCDDLTVATLKTLAATSHQSIGYTLDQAVEYFARKVQFEKDKPLKWSLPDDF
jgi:antitoxin component of RelBE/YafQ-DinJ toxin-antitoxin module